MSVCELCYEAVREDILDTVGNPTRKQVIRICETIGGDVLDHRCEQVESNGKVTCDCGCRRE